MNFLARRKISVSHGKAARLIGFPDPELTAQSLMAVQKIWQQLTSAVSDLHINCELRQNPKRTPDVLHMPFSKLQGANPIDIAKILDNSSTFSHFVDFFQL